MKYYDAIRVGVIGCGNWGKNLVRNFAELGSLQAVADMDAEVADRMAKQYGVQARGVDQVLMSDDVDAVVISSPAVTHGDLAEKVLAAGKHVFIEKPMALDVGQAEKLCERAEAAGLTLMVGHLLQYHPAFIALRGLCSSGALGAIRYIYSQRLNLGRFRNEENALWSFAPHDISMILSLIDAPLQRVDCVGHRFLQHDVADITNTHLTFQTGQAAHVFVSWLNPFKEQKLVVVGTNKMAVFDDCLNWAEKVKVYPHQVAWPGGAAQPSRALAETLPLEPSEPLKLECEHFLECIATGKKPRTDGHEGVRVLRVLCEAQEVIADKALVPFGDEIVSR